jgi:hypothetical protein
MQLANLVLRMTAGRQRYPIMFRVSGYSHKSYFTLTTVPGLASLRLCPEESLSYVYPNSDSSRVPFQVDTTSKVDTTSENHVKV